MIAFVDESIVQTQGGLYLVAVAVVVREQAEEIRERARGVLLPGQVRFHWRDEKDDRRLAMLKCIADLEILAHGYIHRPPPGCSQDRSRALCLERMLWDLRQAGIGEVVIETRQEHNDRKDRQTIFWAQRKGIASEDLSYRHGRPKEEPLLWLPDAIAGALRSDETEGTGYLEEASGILVDRQEIDP